jgi:hypothetical protein
MSKSLRSRVTGCRVNHPFNPTLPCRVKNRRPEDRGEYRSLADHVQNGEKLAGFEIAAKDGEYLPAEARIDDFTVVVSSDRVADPVRVRYAWADDPKATLENREGLPASLFRAKLK